MTVMDPQELKREIHAFDPSIPIRRAWTPPSSWYVDAAVERLERTAVWERTWQLAALGHQLPRNGSFVATTIAQQPVVVVRGEDGRLRAFHNVCRHKASTLCHGAGEAPDLHCPYHGWKYRLDGSLKSAPQLSHVEEFERSEMGLVELAVEAWGPWVFVNTDREAAPLRPQVAELDERLERSGWARLVHRATRTWQIQCNWKAFCDNYLDGGYHIPNMHPTLNSQLDMPDYVTETFAISSIQSAPAGRGDHEGLKLAPEARIGDGAAYGWIYPNFMVNRYGPVMDINVVRPTGPETCEVTFDWWFEPDCDERFIAESMAQTAVTQEEDVLISRRVQEGLRSPAYTSGRYAPAKETGIHHFHRLLAADLRAALEPRAFDSRP